MKIYEIIEDKKTNQKKIIINFPDKSDFKFLKSLKGAKYYHNTGIWVIDYDINNIYELDSKNYFGYIESSMHVFNLGYIDNNYIVITGNDFCLYALIKKYTFLDYSGCKRFGKFDGKKLKRIYFFKSNKGWLKIPIGFINDFKDFDIIDNRIKRKWKFTDDQIKNCLGYLQLYDIQIEAVKSCLKNTNGIIELVGGLGKCCSGDTIIEIEYDDEVIKL